MKALASLALVLALSFRPSWAYGYEDALDQGTIIAGITAGNLQMGGAVAIGYGQPSSVLLNPANLGRVSSPGLEVNIGPGIATETIEDSTGRHTRNNIGLGPASLAVRIPAGRSLSLGAGIARVSDLTYDGQHYIADDPLIPGYITGSETLESNGGLWEAVAGCSYRVARWLSIGVSVGPRFGSTDFVYEFDDRVGEDDSTATWGWVESGVCMHAGATVPFGANSASLSWISGSDHYPSRIAAGAILYSGGTIEAFSFGLEGEIRDPGEANIFLGRVSARFSPNPGFVMGGGLFFSDRGSDSSRSNLGIGLGVAISLGRAVLQGSFAFHNTSRQAVAFGYEGFDKVEDKLGYFGLGLDWTL